MKRRNFIKLLPALATVPVVVKAAKTTFLDLQDTPDECFPNTVTVTVSGLNKGTFIFEAWYKDNIIYSRFNGGEWKLEKNLKLSC
jgi:hypothetical protein